MWFSVVHKLCNRYCNTELNCVSCYFPGMHDGEIDTIFVQLVGKICLNSVDKRTLRRAGNGLLQNIPWSTTMYHYVMLRLVCGVWCAVRETRITDPIYFLRSCNRCVTPILTPFFEHLSDYEGNLAFFFIMALQNSCHK
jgi:hypothetical protein